MPSRPAAQSTLRLISGPWRTLRPQRKCNVVGDSQVRIEAIALKHHGDATRARRDVIDDFVVDQDVAGRLPLETGDDPQEGGLAATRWTSSTRNSPSQADKLTPSRAATSPKSFLMSLATIAAIWTSSMP